jgi:hypothetical protein
MDQTPAVIPVISEIRVSKAKGEEIAIVEPVVAEVPVVAEASIKRKVIAIERTPAEPLNTSAGHRRSDHRASTHSATPKTTAVECATSASKTTVAASASKTTAVASASKTTAVASASKTTAVASATDTGHSSRAHAQCRNGH